MKATLIFVRKLKKMMSSWSARNLTLLGKIATLKSLVASQIVYLLSSLPSPPGVIKEINFLLYDFLWDSKDLLDDSNYNFLSYTAFITKCNIKTNYLEY